MEGETEVQRGTEKLRYQPKGTKIVAGLRFKYNSDSFLIHPCLTTLPCWQLKTSMHQDSLQDLKAGGSTKSP